MDRNRFDDFHYPPRTMVTTETIKATKAVTQPVINFLDILLSSCRQYPMKNRSKMPTTFETFKAIS